MNHVCSAATAEHVFGVAAGKCQAWHYGIGDWYSIWREQAPGGMADPQENSGYWTRRTLSASRRSSKFRKCILLLTSVIDEILAASPSIILLCRATKEAWLPLVCERPAFRKKPSKCWSSFTRTIWSGRCCQIARCIGAMSYETCGSCWVLTLLVPGLKDDPHDNTSFQRIGVFRHDDLAQGQQTEGAYSWLPWSRRYVLLRNPGCLPLVQKRSLAPKSHRVKEAATPKVFLFAKRG